MSGPREFKVIFCDFEFVTFLQNLGNPLVKTLSCARITFAIFTLILPLLPTFWHLSFIKASLVPPLLQSLFPPVLLQLCCLSLICSVFGLREIKRALFNPRKKSTIINMRTLRTYSCDFFLSPLFARDCERRELFL